MAEKSLDEIMSERNSPSEEAASAADFSPAAPAANPSSDRDDKGRFASKVAPEAGADVSATPPAQPLPGHVPIQALDAERNRRKETEERHERELREMRDQLARLTPAAQPKPAETPVSLWDNPDEYLKTQLTPFQSEMLEMREMMSESMAVQAHGAETVQAAKTALEQVARTPEGQQMVQKLMQSRHPFDELVTWHKRRQVTSEVGEISLPLSSASSMNIFPSRSSRSPQQTPLRPRRAPCQPHSQGPPQGGRVAVQSMAARGLSRKS